MSNWYEEQQRKGLEQQRQAQENRKAGETGNPGTFTDIHSKEYREGAANKAYRDSHPLFPKTTFTPSSSSSWTPTVSPSRSSGGSGAGGGAKTGGGFTLLVILGVLFFVFHSGSSDKTSSQPAETSPQPAQTATTSNTFQGLANNREVNQSATATVSPNTAGDSQAIVVPSPQPQLDTARTQSPDAVTVPSNKGSAVDYESATSPSQDTGPSRVLTAAQAQMLAGMITNQAAYTGSYAAKHKEGLGGGCKGQLELTASALRFACQDEPDLDFAVSSIKGVDEDGVRVAITPGKTKAFHFTIAGKTDDQVKDTFKAWWNGVQAQGISGVPF